MEYIEQRSKIIWHVWKVFEDVEAWILLLIIQARNDGGLEQANTWRNDKWWTYAYTLKVEQRGFIDGFYVVWERGVKYDPNVFGLSK